jgi:hypothetical protein
VDNVLLYFRVQYDQIQNLYRTQHRTFAKKQNYIAPVADELFQQAAPASTATGAHRPRGMDYDDVDWSAFSTFDQDSNSDEIPQSRLLNEEAQVLNEHGLGAVSAADSTSMQLLLDAHNQIPVSNSAPLQLSHDYAQTDSGVHSQSSSA